MHNVTVAKHRVAALIDEIPALCALATTASGTFVVRGAAELKVKESNRIATHGDHRVDLAGAILAAATKMPLRIDDSACLATSFPGFVKAWRAAF